MQATVLHFSEMSNHFREKPPTGTQEPRQSTEQRPVSQNGKLPEATFVLHIRPIPSDFRSAAATPCEAMNQLIAFDLARAHEDVPCGILRAAIDNADSIDPEHAERAPNLVHHDAHGLAVARIGIQGLARARSIPAS